MMTTEQLAINGGAKAFDRPFPARHLFGEEEKRAAIAVFDKAIETGEATGYNGEEEDTYCRNFAEYLGGGYCDGVNSGTNAIYVALRALEIEPFTEVIVPAITDAGGAMPVALINCIPVIADTNLHSYNVGPEQIEERITEYTSAIIVTHIAGIPVDMDPIMELARARGIKVIEDCAQAHGAKYKGRMCGSIGDISAFSTMSIKHHATAAQGGVVFTKDEDMYWRARRASDRGKPLGLKDVETTTQGFSTGGFRTNLHASLNMNSNDLSAAVGIEQLKKLPGIVEDRRTVANAICQGVAKLKAVKMVDDPADCQGVHWFLIFDVDESKITVSKEDFANAIAAEGLPAHPTYIPPMTQWDWFKNRRVFGTSAYPWAAPEYKGDPDMPLPLPNFETMDRRLFRMEFHENLSDHDVDDIVAAFEKVDSAYAK